MSNKRIISLDILKFISSIIIAIHHFQGAFKFDGLLVDLTNKAKISGGTLIILFF